MKGQGAETWHPRFKGNATRYAQVEGFPGTPTLNDFEGLVIHTDMEPVGQFTCSNPLINKIYQNARWGTRMQNRSVPMEPDRDERMPWSGHPAKTSESEGYAFNVARFYDHFLHNYRVHQGADGSLQEILPPYWTFNSKDIIWPSIFTIIPDWYFNFYGDVKPLADNFDAMKRWVFFHQKAYQKPDFTIDYCNYGDWVDGSWIKGTLDKRTTSRPLMSTAYYYNNCRIVARAARLVGKDDDARKFDELADRVKAAFNVRFFNPKTNKYESETQGSYIFPLAFGMVPESHVTAVIANLVDEIQIKAKGHTSVGLVGMQWFMQTLTDVGRPDVAYTVATQTTRPSWGYMVSKGATTSWERWDTDIQDGGMNGESQKILSGNLEAWMYQTLGGINYDPEHPGFKHIILRPRPVGDLSFVRCSHRSLYGPIQSDWKKEGGAFRVDRGCASQHDSDGVCAGEGCKRRDRRQHGCRGGQRGAVPANGRERGGLFRGLGELQFSIAVVRREWQAGNQAAARHENKRSFTDCPGFLGADIGAYAIHARVDQCRGPARNHPSGIPCFVKRASFRHREREVSPL